MFERIKSAFARIGSLTIKYTLFMFNLILVKLDNARKGETFIKDIKDGFNDKQKVSINFHSIHPEHHQTNIRIKEFWEDQFYMLKSWFPSQHNYLSGVTLLCLGVVIKHSVKEYELVIDDSYLSASNLLIVSGALLFIFAFFGCCGAYLESHRLLIVYSALIALIFILEIAAVIAGYALSDRSEDIFESALNHTFNQNGTREFWDNMQANLECCGIHNYSDYTTILNTTLPDSCCPHITTPTPCNRENAFGEGCCMKIKELIERNAMTIGTGALSVIALQIVGMFCAICLAKSIMNSYETF